MTTGVGHSVGNVVRFVNSHTVLQSSRTHTGLTGATRRDTVTLNLATLATLALTVKTDLLLNQQVVAPLSLVARTTRHVTQRSLDRPLVLAKSGRFSTITRTFGRVIDRLHRILRALRRQMSRHARTLTSTGGALRTRARSLRTVLRGLHHDRTSCHLLISCLRTKIIIRAPSAAVVVYGHVKTGLLKVTASRTVNRTTLRTA